MRFDTLAAWLDWQAGLNPKAIELGLDRVRHVWRAMGEPVLDGAVITVAGTNGKGSSVAFAEAILQAAGYRTGCYTSPHLVHYNERIRIDQQAADDPSICQAFERIDQARGDIALTYFEFGTLAALALFADRSLDAVILEVGLGGRLDAVNLVDPDVALITSIGLDHQSWLGDDVEKIGAEKAGILRHGRPAVFSGRAMPNSIRQRADEIGAALRVAGTHFRVERHADAWDLLSGGQARRALPNPGMRGAVQIENAAGVLVALDTLRERLPVDQRAVRAGLLGARLNGRFEVRPGKPTWILDVAHNPQAAAVLSDMLGDAYFSGRRIAVCGMLDDKDAGGVAKILAKRFDAWHLVDLSDQPRGLSAEGLKQRVSGELSPGVVSLGGTVARIMDKIQADSAENDLVVVFGSFLTVGAATEWLERAD